MYQKSKDLKILVDNGVKYLYVPRSGKTFKAGQSSHNHKVKKSCSIQF